MFTNIRLPFVAATRLGNKLLVKSRSYQLVLATFMTVMIIGMASPAQAVETAAIRTAEAPNFMCYIGAPSLEVFDPAKTATQKITGIVLGIVVLVAAVGVIMAGIRILTAGKHKDKSSDGVRQISNVFMGIIAIFGGLLILGILITVAVALPTFCA